MTFSKEEVIGKLVSELEAVETASAAVEVLERMKQAIIALDTPAPAEEAATPEDTGTITYE